MGAGGLSLPGVERVMAEMEGGSVEDMKEKFARLGRRVCLFFHVSASSDD
jgi:dynein light intermediate chain 1